MSRSRAGARSIGVTLLQGAGRDSRKCLFCPLDCLWMAAARGCRSFFGARHAGRALERLRRCAVGFGYAGRCEGKWCVSVASGELTAERDEWVVFGMRDGSGARGRYCCCCCWAGGYCLLLKSSLSITAMSASLVVDISSLQREAATYHPPQTLSPIQHNPPLQPLGSQPTTSSYSPTSKHSRIRHYCVAKVPEHDVVRQR
jgi:hypothetical protein